MKRDELRALRELEAYKHKLRKDYIKFYGGRPKRNRVIDKEDIVNLKIALNTATSITEFINQV